jgi:general secretion pathway protein K
MKTECQKGQPPLGWNLERGSILVIVMVTLVFTVAALVAFLDKAGNDLLVESRRRVADRLRMDAYSALEVSLAVLEDFRLADNNALRTPNEGWSDPLTWADWAPQDGNPVEVSFEDESGKYPLAHVNQQVLNEVFQAWGMSQNDSQHLTDVLLAWMQKSYVPQTGLTPDYEQMAFPYDAPLRPMRSYNELAAIDYAKDLFYDENGRPNDLWWRFYKTFSLFNYRQPNINALNNDVLSGVGQFDDTAVQNISNYIAGTGDYKATSPLGKQWFQSATDVKGVVGSVGKVNAFGTTIAALRIFITVHDGASQFRLSVVVAPKGGATTVMTTATDVRNAASSANSGETVANTGSAGTNSATSISSSSSVPTAAQTAAAAMLHYPFTILEIRENDEILTPPPPASPAS